ncbi:interleukin-19 [Suncus etruscus]|uniref:interleukin-19 n=1 Tax=Suncus etruscus TaxID=109475 RepID=UPI002110A223|nr:interleukin-19 [Suncus etruscus]
MKKQCASFWLLGAVALPFLCLVHARSLMRCLVSMDVHHIEESFQEIKKAIQAKDTFQNITILATSETLKNIQPSDVCCMTKNLLAFYVDRVFKDHQELNPHILRKISSIANSFLYLHKTLLQCVLPFSYQEQRRCHCRPEIINATRTIHNNYSELEVPSAAIKSLGELDVLLAWIHKNHQETSTVEQ